MQSPIFTPQVMDAITETLDEYLNHLESIGFEILKEVAPVGVQSGSFVMGFRTKPEETELYLSQKDTMDVRSALIPVRSKSPWKYVGELELSATTCHHLSYLARLPTHEER
jgi:hypothetical protein